MLLSPSILVRVVDLEYKQRDESSDIVNEFRFRKDILVFSRVKNNVIAAGVRNTQQAEANCAVSDKEPISDALEAKLRFFNWRRAFGYRGL